MDDTERAVREVREALAALDDAFARQDLPAVLEMFTPDVLFIGSGDGEEASGRHAIEPMFDGLRPHLVDLEFVVKDWETVDVDVLGDIALVAAFAPAHLRTPRRESDFRYRFTGVLVRQNGRWRWRVHHGSEAGAW